MNDPHLVSVTYRLHHSTGIAFNDPPPLSGTGPGFDYRLESGKLTLEMTDHFTNVDDAKVVIEPWLRAWEIDQNLKARNKTIWFQFDTSHVVDRAPTPGRLQAAVGLATSVEMACQLTGTARYRAYPTPPAGFAASSQVEVMWRRFQQFREGKEPLLSMAYACLSFLESTTAQKQGSRRAVCSKYAIDEGVRTKLGDLVSEKGSPEEARKLDHGATGVPLSGAEKEWVEQVILALIRRKAEYDHDPSRLFPQITLTDFPHI